MSKKLIFILLFLFVSNVAMSSESKSVDVGSNKEIELGLLPYVSASRLIKTFLPLKRYLEKVTSYEVTFVTAPTFEKFVGRTNNNQYDIVFTAPHFALFAEKTSDYKRLARFSRELAACVFVDKNSAIGSLSELKGLTVSTPNFLAIVSVLGEVMLKEAGLSPLKDVAFIRTRSHNNVIISVANKMSEAGIVASTVYEQFISKARNRNKFRLLGCSESVPTAMFLANSSLSKKENTMFKKALLEFPESSEGKLFFKNTPFKGMKLINDGDMKELERYVGELKAKL